MRIEEAAATSRGGSGLVGEVQHLTPSGVPGTRVVVHRILYGVHRFFFIPHGGIEDVSVVIHQADFSACRLGTRSNHFTQQSIGSAIILIHLHLGLGQKYLANCLIETANLLHV